MYTIFKNKVPYWEHPYGWLVPCWAGPGHWDSCQPAGSRGSWLTAVLCHRVRSWLVPSVHEVSSHGGEQQNQKICSNVPFLEYNSCCWLQHFDWCMNLLKLACMLDQLNKITINDHTEYLPLKQCESFIQFRLFDLSQCKLFLSRWIKPGVSR